MKPHWWRAIPRSLGWSLLLISIGVAASLTGWSLLSLLGVTPAPSPGSRALAPSELASFAVAGATLLLATVTVLLAVFTRRSLDQGRRELQLAELALSTAQDQVKKQAEQVTATEAQADVARQTLEASFRPTLVDVPLGPATRYSPAAGQVLAAEIVVAKDQQGTVTVEVPLRNIGAGPAVIAKAILSVGQLHTAEAVLTSSIVAVGESLLIGFEIKPEGAVLINLASQVAAMKPCVVTVIYGGQGGPGSWRSRVYLRARNANRYEIERVELYAGEEIIPFATTGQA